MVPCVLIHDSLAPDEPLQRFTESDAEDFHKRNQLPVERDVFVRGVMALRHQSEIRFKFEKIAEKEAENKKEAKKIGTAHIPHKPVSLKIQTHEYTELESEVLYQAWTRSKKETFRNLSRLHRLLVVTCIYAAMTQYVMCATLLASMKADEIPGAGIKPPWQVRLAYAPYRCTG